MNVPLFTWSCIVGLFIAILILRTVHVYGYCSHRQHRVIEMGDEREELFAPGDRQAYQDENEDYDCGKDY
ncbi:MAG: hypothetical protein K2G27_10890 [Duncaniella sp.]|nr:hypothetical protein [Duncaniella sp.]